MQGRKKNESKKGLFWDGIVVTRLTGLRQHASSVRFAVDASRVQVLIFNIFPFFPQHPCDSQSLSLAQLTTLFSLPLRLLICPGLGLGEFDFSFFSNISTVILRIHTGLRTQLCSSSVRSKAFAVIEKNKK